MWQDKNREEERGMEGVEIEYVECQTEESQILSTQSFHVNTTRVSPYDSIVSSGLFHNGQQDDERGKII